MSSKLDFIPYIPGYDYIRRGMNNDLKYRLANRTKKTSLGRPLYERINVQLIMTQECPYHCPFCLERQHPMKGMFDAEAQIEALKKVLEEHPNARLSITGGEPGLYPDHVKNLVETFKKHSNDVFVSVNTAGFSTELNGCAHLNLSVNDYVKPDCRNFPGCTVQTVFTEEQMTLSNVMKFMNETPASSFSFRFLSSLDKHDYNVEIFNEMRKAKCINVKTFRIGDFFTYCTFDCGVNHARVTLGDMYQQTHNDYQDGYSNIIIHPDGRVGVNWK